MSPRRIAAVLSLVALAVPIAACGGSSGGDDKSITVWSLEKEPDRVATTKQILAGFTKKTGIKTRLVAVDEDQLPTLVTSASAAGRLPDVMYLPLASAQAYAEQGILDPDAAQEVVDQLGKNTFSQKALSLVTKDGKAVAVPSDGWGQLLIYRKDLFDQAGLPVPDSLDKIQQAAAKLNKPGMAGITLGTKPGDAFTEQSFEYFALADGCQLVNGDGNITIDSPQCVDTFRRYGQLAKDYSVKGAQDVDSTRGTYFAGRAAMIVWSPFLLDAMAGLRKDAVPSCPQCKKDPAFLAKNSGIITALQGPNGQSAQFGEVSSWGITADGNVDGAKQFAKYMLSDGYTRWLGISPQGKFPVRTGDKSDAQRFVKAWGNLESGVDEKAPLSKFYSKESIDALAKGVQTFQRWGFAQGQGALVGAMSSEQPIPKEVAAVINGTSPEDAAKEAKSAIEQIQASLK